MQLVASVKVPALVLPVKDDATMKSDAIQQFCDALPNPDKKLVWVEGTHERFKGYCYFSKNPSELVEWFDAH